MLIQSQIKVCYEVNGSTEAQRNSLGRRKVWICSFCKHRSSKLFEWGSIGSIAILLWMSVEIFKKCKNFSKKFPQDTDHTEGRRQYDHHNKLTNVQQSFNLWTEQLPDNNPLKPTNLKRINYGIVQLENFMEKAQKLRNSVRSSMMQVHLRKLAN